MTRNSRLNSLSGTKNKRLLFKVVKTNWTHNNRPFLDTSCLAKHLAISLPASFITNSAIREKRLMNDQTNKILTENSLNFDHNLLPHTPVYTTGFGHDSPQLMRNP